MYGIPIRWLVLVAVLVAGYLIVFGGASSKNLGARKVTIEMATPQGTMRDSSVFELTYSSAPWWYPAAVTSSTGIKGEAPCIDLGNGRYLFMLLHDHLYQKGMVSYLISEKNRGGANSAYDRTPIFVTFDNIEDPNSIREVDRNALDRTFGPGYRLVNLTVANTQERATQGTLARRFAALRSALREPSSKRLPTPGLEYRPDLRQIDWSAFDSVPGP